MKDKRKMIYYCSVILCVVIILNNLLFRGLFDEQVEDISYDVFLDQVYSMNVKEVEYSKSDGYIYFTLKKDLPDVQSDGKDEVV